MIRTLLLALVVTSSTILSIATAENPTRPEDRAKESRQSGLRQGMKSLLTQMKLVSSEIWRRTSVAGDNLGFNGFVGRVCVEYASL